MDEGCTADLGPSMREIKELDALLSVNWEVYSKDLLEAGGARRSIFCKSCGQLLVNYVTMRYLISNDGFVAQKVLS